MKDIKGSEKGRGFQITNKLNIIAEKTKILTSSPLREFSGIFGQAYEVADLSGTVYKDRYIFVFDSQYPYMADLMIDMVDHQFSHITKPLLFEILPVGEANNYKLCAIIKRPQGISLREYIKQNGSLSEQQISDFIIPAVVKCLIGFEELSYAHGSINPDCIYVNNINGMLDVMLLDPIREPCGFAQPAAYEIVERMTVLNLGKGVCDTSSDYFALGVLVCFCIKGALSAEALELDMLVEKRIDESAYETYATEITASMSFKNMLKGLLCDRKAERWGTLKMVEWLKGRRFNFTVLRLYKKATRIFNIGEKKFSTVGTLAFNLFQDWEMGKKAIKDPKLVKWVEGGIGSPDIAERLTYTLKMGSSMSFIHITEDEILSRIITILDPENGIRYRNINTHAEGLGVVLANAFAKEVQEHLNQVYQIFDSSIINMTIENRTMGDKVFASFLLMNLDRFKLYIKKNEFGFGMERLLYELNPTMVCQNKDVIKYYCFSVVRLLYILNDICDQIELGILDRHISAFIAAKLNFKKEVRITSISQYPEIESNRVLRSLAMLSVAQRDTNVNNLKNLTRRYAELSKDVIVFIRSKTTRDELLKRVEKVSDSGFLEDILNVCCDPTMIKRDYENFQAAQRKFLELENYIMNASNNKKIFDLGYNYGLKIAMVISYFVCTIATVIIFGRLVFDT